jgi:two-component system sensor histidine kinase KdpD
LIGEIQEANARLNRVVGNLLDVARLESGQVRPRLDWHDARDLVQTTLRELQRELAVHPVKLDLPVAPLLVRLDFFLAQHALANLLLNAANHTPAGTPIEVSAQLANDQLALSVADRGPGIPPEWLPRIFDKFFRAPTAPTGGSGLGLTIVKGFVEVHGGTITATNRPGGGVMFTLIFPQPEKPPD